MRTSPTKKLAALVARNAEIERLLTFADEVPLNRTGPLRYPPLAELQR